MVLTAVQVAPGTIWRDACANTAESSSEVDLAKLTILNGVHAPALAGLCNTQNAGRRDGSLAEPAAPRVIYTTTKSSMFRFSKAPAPPRC